MDRRNFITRTGAAASFLAGALSFHSQNLFAAIGSPLRDIPELRSKDGYLKTDLVMENAHFVVGNRMITVPAYNGSLPGPTIRVKPGDRFEWDLYNRMTPTGIPAGATAEQIEQFNQLEYTNVHTHGLQVSPAKGHDNVYCVLKPFEDPLNYSYDVPGPATGRPQPAGMCWYHPHKHGSTTHQAWQGLSGAIIIEGDIDDVPQIKRARERVIVLNALFLNPEGEVPRAAVAPNAGYSPFTPIPSVPTDMLLTLNGQLEPIIDIQPGEVQRWRILCAAPHRFYWLDLDGHTFYQIGQDGIPFAEARPVTRILIAPGNRVELMVKGGAEGRYRLQAMQYEQGHPGGARPTRLLATLVSSGPSRDDPLPDKLVTPPQMPDRSVSCHRKVVFKGEISGNDRNQAKKGPPFPPVQFYLDGKVFDIDRIDQHVVADTVEEWTLVNQDVFQHPFHIHVNPFQIVKMNGQPVTDKTWWDTFALPSKGSVTIRTYFRPDIIGKTVYHCHILPHEDNGMMANILIQPPGSTVPRGECSS